MRRYFPGLGSEVPSVLGLESAGWHINLALAAFGIGFSVAIFTGKFYRRDVDKQAIERAKKAAHWSSIGLMLASLIFFLFAFKSYGNLLNYARHELFSSHADSRGFGAFMMIFPGSVLCYFFSAITLRQNIFGTVLAVFVFLMFSDYGLSFGCTFSCTGWCRAVGEVRSTIAVACCGLRRCCCSDPNCRIRLFKDNG